MLVTSAGCSALIVDDEQAIGSLYVLGSRYVASIIILVNQYF